MDRRAFFTLAGVSATAIATGGVLSSCSLLPSSVVIDAGSISAVGQPDINFASYTDVLIIGSGISGLSAAMAPLEVGYGVMIAEKLNLLGGESYSSNGIMNVAGSNVQISAGLELTAEEAWVDRKQVLKDEGEENLDYAETLYLAATEWINALEDSYGARLEDPSSYASSGENDAIVLPWGGIGYLDSFMIPLRDALSGKGVQFRTDYRAEAFITSAEGEVCGVRFMTASGSSPVDIGAQCVIVATGGYAGNQSMVETYASSSLTAGCLTSASVGEGHDLCTCLGGRLTNMSSTMPLIGDIPQISAWGMFTPVLVVDALGRRFAQEDEVNAVANACFSDERGYWWTIFDAQISSSGQSSSAAQMSSKYNNRLVGPCDDIESLAEKLGTPSSTLQSTFEAYEQVVTQGVDDAFGRTLQLKSLEPPYYAFKQFPVRYRSRGGVQTNTFGQVLNGSGVVIPKVYCCGSASGHGGAGLASNGAHGMLVGQAVVDLLDAEALIESEAQDQAQDQI